MHRQKVARANLEADIWAADFTCTVDVVERDGNGYTIRVSRGSREFVRSGIDEAVLEDEWAESRQRLVADIRKALLGEEA
jgi:hypothetical protein